MVRTKIVFAKIWRRRRWCLAKKPAKLLSRWVTWNSLNERHSEFNAHHVYTTFPKEQFFAHVASISGPTRKWYDVTKHFGNPKAPYSRTSLVTACQRWDLSCPASLPWNFAGSKWIVYQRSCVCWWDCRKDRWGRWERTCACGQCQVRQGKTWHVDDSFIGTQRCAILCLPALEPRLFPCWNVVNLFTMCCDTLCVSLHVVWVGVLFTLSVGCLEVFLQATETCPNSEIFFTNRQTLKECREFQLLIFQWVRSQCDDDDEAVPRCSFLPCPQMLVLYAVLEVVL